MQASNVLPQMAMAHRHNPFHHVPRFMAAGALAAATVVVCHWLPHVNITTIALILVLEVAGIALRWGRIEAVSAALAAALGLDYYFLPPRGFGIDSPDHWVALVAFLVTAFGTALARGRVAEKEMEAEIARRSDDLKSAVFSALAHDARGPLSSIKIAATTLLSDRPGSAAQQRELMGIILDEVDRMNLWIDQASRVSQVEAAQFALHKEPRDVRDLVFGAIDEFGPRLSGRPIGIEIPDGLPMADCDGEMIQRVLKLLLDNAVKYSPFGAPIRVSGGVEEDRLVVTVSDFGAGVPEDERTRIFEKHYRGAYENSGVPGTGLGLSSARQMLESQGGEIWVTNRETGGAAFHFSLPVAMGTTA